MVWGFHFDTPVNHRVEHGEWQLHRIRGFQVQQGWPLPALCKGAVKANLNGSAVCLRKGEDVPFQARKSSMEHLGTIWAMCEMPRNGMQGNVSGVISM